MIDGAILSVIRRWHFREGISVREIARRTKLSRNTISKYLASGVVEPRYGRRKCASDLLHRSMRQVVVVKLYVAFDRSVQILTRAEARGRQDVADAAVEALAAGALNFNEGVVLEAAGFANGPVPEERDAIISELEDRYCIALDAILSE